MLLYLCYYTNYIITFYYLSLISSIIKIEHVNFSSDTEIASISRVVSYVVKSYIIVIFIWTFRCIYKVIFLRSWYLYLHAEVIFNNPHSSILLSFYFLFFLFTFFFSFSCPFGLYFLVRFLFCFSFSFWFVIFFVIFFFHFHFNSIFVFVFFFF